MTSSHTYADDGAYTLGVSVADLDDADQAEVAVTIVNADPRADLGGDETVDEGTAWTRTRTATDPGADTLTGVVTFAAGAPQDASSAATGATR